MDVVTEEEPVDVGAALSPTPPTRGLKQYLPKLVTWLAKGAKVLH
jgi:hypothetical protein